MIRLVLPLAAAVAAAFAAVPAQAFVGYGIEAGTPLYDALKDGYRPYPYYRPLPRYGRPFRRPR